jgi:hypothetical protein
MLNGPQREAVAPVFLRPGSNDGSRLHTQAGFISGHRLHTHSRLSAERADRGCGPPVQGLEREKSSGDVAFELP